MFIKKICYFIFSPQSNDVFLLFLVDKVLEQLRGRSSKTSDRPHMNASARIAPRRGMILPFEPLSMSFSEINYYVDMPAVCSLPIYIYFLSKLPSHAIAHYYMNDR